MDSGLQVTYDYIIPTCSSMLLHPLLYARTMMMLGYEPDPPQLRPVLYTLIDKSYRRYVFPNVFAYLRRLREEVGLVGLFTTGLPASVLGAHIKAYSTEKLMERLTTCVYKKSFYVTDRGVKVFLIETSKLTIARVFGVTVSYPFQVIMIRQMAEFAGCDGAYGNLLFALPRILKNEGIMSLFNGLIPRLLGEIITVWMISCFVYVLNQYVFTENVDPSLKQYTPMVAAMMVSNSTHPLTVSSTVMSVSNSRLSLALPFRNWWDCYRYLSATGCLGRGSSLFFRYAPHSYIKK
ncbi:Mitochondrial carrier 2 [Paragonimus heterotremus]|uniref:Mitochondrial carrier 2 n=1 Tax=Paragonimus heterotremus TaxID=100268 RepID=A0A8J4TBD1_9TREM|nr:Mitochondrial carrier 2 [Paragonimus heterotremus]